MKRQSYIQLFKHSGDWRQRQLHLVILFSRHRRRYVTRPGDLVWRPGRNHCSCNGHQERCALRHCASGCASGCKDGVPTVACRGGSGFGAGAASSGVREERCDSDLKHFTVTSSQRRFFLVNCRRTVGGNASLSHATV